MVEEIKNLIEEKKYSEIKTKIINLEEADIAEILCELDKQSLIKIFRLICSRLTKSNDLVCIEKFW